MIEGLKLMEQRLQQYGGQAQQDRMIRDKLRSLDSALWYSYQGAWVRHAHANEPLVRALINPNKLKQDYDEKIISTHFESNFKVGDVFEWANTNSYWLIYLQELTELAYFRANIRRCNYEIDMGGKKTYIVLRGPVETRIESLQKHGISVDVPNWSLNLLVPSNEDTINYFKRYDKFYLQGDTTCWRIEAVDKYSTPGIIEITAVEYYANETTDDIEAGVVDGKIKPIVPEHIGELITGETFIKPKISYTYIADSSLSGEWFIESTKLPLELTVSDYQIELKWTSAYSGSFDLCFGDKNTNMVYKKTIIVESLF